MIDAIVNGIIVVFAVDLVARPTWSYIKRYQLRKAIAKAMRCQPGRASVGGKS